MPQLPGCSGGRLAASPAVCQPLRSLITRRQGGSNCIVHTRDQHPKHERPLRSGHRSRGRVAVPGRGKGSAGGCAQQRRQRGRREGTGSRGDGSGNPRPERLKPLRAEGPRRPDPRPPREGSTRGPRRLGAGGLARPGPAKGMGVRGRQ
ncbi:unnamed protein product [Coccothraustes coccothraustes]